MIKTVLLDLSGVVYQDNELLSGALDAIAVLRQNGLHLKFVTNTTRSTKHETLQNLKSLGLQCEASELFMPAQAACTWLELNHCSPHLLVHPAIESEFSSCKQDRPVAVVVGDAGEAFNYTNLNHAFRVLQNGGPLLALAKNRYFRDKDGELSLDAGPFLAALEFACGRDALVLGKPSGVFFSLALHDTGCGLDEAAMIGDDVESDVSGALEARVGVGILVRTGKYRPNDETLFQPAPTAVVDNILAAADWILQHNAVAL